jgi:hypothetical protein
VVVVGKVVIGFVVVVDDGVVVVSLVPHDASSKIPTRQIAVIHFDGFGIPSSPFFMIYYLSLTTELKTCRFQAD